MNEPKECLKARSALTSLKLLQNNNIAFSTKLHGIKIFSPNDCCVILNYANELINTNTTAIAFSLDGLFVAFANDSLIYLVDLQEKKHLRTINTDGEFITILEFDDESKNLVAGSKNGRVLQYRVDSVTQISRLCSFPHTNEDRSKFRQNYVSALAIHKNRLACSGYGGDLLILDISSRSNIIALKSGPSRTNALCFLDENRVASGNFDGVVKIFDIDKKSTLCQINTSHTRIKQIVKLTNTNFIIISSKTNYLTVIDVKNFKILSNKYIETKDNIAYIESIDESKILIVFADGTFTMQDLASTNELRSLIIHNSLDKAYELAYSDPILKDSKEFAHLEEIYKNLYNKATIALINQNIALANELTRMFVNVASKKREINSLFISFKNYNRFKIFFLEKKYSLSYAICEKYPELKNTPIYRKMEENWREVFKNAQRQLLLGQTNNAKALLNEYAIVGAKKEIINLILKNNVDFIDFIRGVSKKDYAKAAKLCDKNPLLKQTPSYTILINEIQYKTDQISAFIKIGDIYNAKIALNIIDGVTWLSKDIFIYKKTIKDLKKLQDMYDENNYAACFETLDKSQLLYGTDLAVALETYWQKIILRCEEFALKGSVADIKKTLGDFIYIPSRNSKIGDLFRLAYHIRIKTYIVKKSFKQSEDTIYNYLDTFGVDSEIKNLMSKFEKITKQKLAITQNLSIKSRNDWINSDLFLNNRK